MPAWRDSPQGHPVPCGDRRDCVEHGGSLIVPNGGTVLESGDEAIIFTSEEGRDEIRRLFS